MELDTRYVYSRNFLLWGKIGFCASDQETVVKEIMKLPKTPESATVAFVGIPGAIACMEDDEMFHVYNNLTFVSIDGMPIVKKCRKIGIECERCSGPDIMMNIIEESVKRGQSHYFYGGKNDDVLNQIKSRLESRYPSIHIVGMYSPPFRDLTKGEDDKICEEINGLHPDYVWVGIGQPRQDYWASQHKTRLEHTTILGVGAAFDFVAGSLERAPKIIQNLGLEWLYRFIKEPKRLWNRYILGGLKYISYNRKYRDKRII